MKLEIEKIGQSRNTLSKKLSVTFFILFFFIFTLFTLIAFYSTNYFLMSDERTVLKKTSNQVRVRLSEADSNLGLDNLGKILYKNDETHVISNDKHESILKSDRDITNLLYINQDIYIYNVQKHMVFTTDDEEDFTDLTGPIGKVYNDEMDDYRGLSITQKVYSQKTGKLIGYIQVFHDLNPYYFGRDRLLILLLCIEIFATGLALIIISIATRQFLKPFNDLHALMKQIIANPDKLSLRSNIKTGDEIEDLSTIFDKMLERIEDFTKLQSCFVSDVSHELRTPVAVIKGHIGLLQRWGKNEPEILDESLAATAHEANRMSIMINDMLDMIRVKGSFEAHQNDVSELHESIETVIGNFEVIREDFTFTFNNKVPESLFAKIYKNHFEQAILILIDNAVKYSNEDKRITVELSRWDQNFAKVSVIDHGEGISQEDINHIFERFYCTDKSRSRESTQAGLGIGLSLLKQIVTAYHIDLKVFSEVGSGSEFRLLIPLDKEDDKLISDFDDDTSKS